MNQIQEKDWAEESWHSHTGIDSSCDYCIVDEPADKAEVLIKLTTDLANHKVNHPSSDSN